LKKLICKKNIRVLLVLLQTVAVGILSYCLLTIGFWMEGTTSYWEAAQEFVESELFFRQVDGIIRNKIRGQQNCELFETDGVFDGEKEIDIQSYGQQNVTVKDLNTTYLLQDLLDFYQNGGLQQLDEALLAVQEEQAVGGQSAGEQLAARSEQLETIRPVTGISLAECSRWYSDSARFVQEIYQTLSQVCREIGAKYTEYQLRQEESWSRLAPSNLRYYIENSTTGEYYTNLDATDYKTAEDALAADESFVCLYAGERSFNIMVTNTDNVLNDAAEQWFMEERFVNTNEKVLLAVDTSWPVSDELQTYANYFTKRGSMLLSSGIMAVVCTLILVVCLALTLWTTGYTEDGTQVRLYRKDSVPTELSAGIYLILGVIIWQLLMRLIPEQSSLFDANRYQSSLVMIPAYFIGLSAVSEVVRRLRAGTLWTNSICYMLLRSWSKVDSSRMISWRFLFFYLGFFALNICFIVFFRKSVGLFLVGILDLAVLLGGLRDLVGRQSIWEGIHQISRGDLTYKIDTSALQGETYEMACAINEMGDGLQEAVESIIKNERLKAELITNVSHDLKTPLTSIVNYVDLLKRENPEGEKVQHYIAVLEQKAQRLKQLTEDLVEASRISSGNIELDMIELQPGSILEQAYGEFEERFEECGLHAVLQIDREPLTIQADGAQLWRVLENLMGNICKYAKPGTDVFLTFERRDDMACLSLRNTSAEILTVEADELTGRFVRGDASRSTEGSGLGLSIAQNLTQLMGGSFRLHTEQEEFEVTVSFPVHN
jgi:signal transduction histidine kinase